MKRNVYKKRGKKKNKSSKKKGIVEKPYIGRDIRIRELGVSDAITQSFVYRELPTLRFNTSAQVGSIYYRSNDMNNIFDTAAASVPYWESIALMYERYVVLHSSIFVEVQNRELVNSITVCVYPATVNSAISTAASFATVQSLPGAKTYTLQCSSGGMSTHTFRLGISLPRMVGEQYEEQDQWAGINTGSPGGSCVNQSPVTNTFWGIAYYNATGGNTLTNGGITCQVTVKNRVRLNKPIRGLNSDGFSKSLQIPVESSVPNSPPTVDDQLIGISEWLKEHTTYKDIICLSNQLTSLLPPLGGPKVDGDDRSRRLR